MRKELLDLLELTEAVDDDELYSSCINKIFELQEQIMFLQNSKIDKIGRKTEVLDLLQNNKSISIIEISKKLNISTKNVSSQLTYLRSDGYKIFTDEKGRKVLIK